MWQLFCIDLLIRPRTTGSSLLDRRTGSLFKDKSNGVFIRLSVFF